MKTKYYLIFIFIILIIILISIKKPVPMTELYFSAPKELPYFSNGNFNFNFTIHNLENADFEYEVKIIAESNNQETIANHFNISLKKDEKKEFNENFHIPISERVKVKVILAGKNQDIYFYSDYSKEPLKYENLGWGNLDCINETKASVSDRLLINAKADYADGWPQMRAFINGKEIDIFEIPDNESFDVTIPYNFTSGINIIDLMFINDHHNTETEEDRNLYINYIELSEKINADKGTIDNGLNREAVDCKKISSSSGSLYGKSALRFKLNIY